jgi:Sulfotransferase domain
MRIHRKHLFNLDRERDLTIEDPNLVIEAYKSNSAKVRAWPHQDKVLIYHVSQDWEPLCEFLGKPVPLNTPFPHANTRQEFKRRIKNFVLSLMLGPILIILGSIGVYLKCIKPRKDRSKAD